MRESKYWNEAGKICPSVTGNATSQTEFIQGGGFEEDFTSLSLTDQHIRRKIKGMGKKPNVVFSKGYCWHRGTCVYRSHLMCCFITQTTCWNIREVTLVLTKETEHLLGIIFCWRLNLSDLVRLQCVWHWTKNKLNPTRSANCSKEIYNLMLQ